jgi:hypothetical protein
MGHRRATGDAGTEALKDRATLIFSGKTQFLSAGLILLTRVPSSVHARPGPIGSSIEDPVAKPKNETVDRELDLFRDATVSIQAAMTLARKIHAGSKVLDASFDGASGTPLYRIVTYRGKMVWDTSVDGNSGTLVEEPLASPASSLEPADKDNLIALTMTRLGIPDAILISERNSSGRAISAGVMKVNGTLNFVVVVVVGSELKQFFLEPPRNNAISHHGRKQQ